MKSRSFLDGSGKVVRITRLLLLISITAVLARCTTDSEELLLRQFNELDSLRNKVPSILIISPSDNDSVRRPVIIWYVLTNWEVAEGDRHIQYFIDGENRGMLYNNEEASIAEIDTGYHVISLRLAGANFRTLPVFDEVQVSVLPPVPDTYVLSVLGGSGSGAFSPGEEISIHADDPPKGFEFDQWEGDSKYLLSNSAETTVLMPDQDISLSAVYKETLINYVLDIAPLVDVQCLDCHAGLYAPNLSSCDDLSIYASEVALKIVDENDPMPPTGLLDQAKIDLILKWMDQGANCNN